MNIQSVSFGKTPVMTCNVKSKNSNEKQPATLYKMDASNKNDLKEIMYSKNTRCLVDGFLNDMVAYYPTYDYYLLQNDKTNEVISCAQTSRHFRTGKSMYQGCSTLINEMSENKKYINGAEPLFAYLVKNADERYDGCVSTAFDQEEIQTSLKNLKFNQLKTGDWVIPQKRYQTLIEQAKKREDVNFIA